MITDMFPQQDLEADRKISMTYWFPILQQIGMRVPKTIFVHRGDVDLSKMIDAEPIKGLGLFIDRLGVAALTLGYPVFFRTEMTSNKHDWKNSCYVTTKEDFKRCIPNLVETSYLANISGDHIPFDFWAVREMIETNPVFYGFYGEMPISKEFRIFINNHQVECLHPYWPLEAFGENTANDHVEDLEEKIKKLADLSEEDEKELLSMASYIARFFSGFWSVDFLQAKNGDWYCTDMALGERSYHYPDCKIELKRTTSMGGSGGEGVKFMAKNKDKKQKKEVKKPKKTAKKK